MARRRGWTERKQRSMEMKQNSGDRSTPPPRTGGIPNGGRNPPNCGREASQNFGDSEREKKRR
jgi:hypothetical protein